MSIPDINKRIKIIIESMSKGKELAFANEIGISQPRINRLFNIDPRNNKYPLPSLDIIQSIINKFIDISADWLLSGKGPMLKSDMKIQELNNFKIPEKRIDHQEIPLYNLEATAGLRELFSSNTPSEILDTIKIPNLPRCDGAITITGDSMYPLLKSGDMVLYAKTSVENIFYGEMYLIGIKLNDLDEFVTVKYIQKSDIKDHITLVSQNTDHSSKDIPISSIIAIAIVKASIRINTMF